MRGRRQRLNDDQERMVLTMAGAGFAVIAPDLAGYANYGADGNPPSAYNSSPDVARSTLDGARALRKLQPSKFTEQIVLTGHSQGGHIALSALAAADSYGADGEIAAVATFVPNWLSQRTWGALFLLAVCCHYVIDSASYVADLTAALSEVASKFLTSCVFLVPKDDPSKFNPGLVNVYVDGELLQQNAPDGWTYTGGGTDALEIHGTTCDELLSGNAEQVEIQLGCATVVY